MMELRKKILILRDIIDLPPLEGAASINEVFMKSVDEFFSKLNVFRKFLF